MNEAVPQHSEEWWQKVDPAWKRQLDSAMREALKDTNDLTDEELAEFLTLPSLPPPKPR